MKRYAYKVISGSNNEQLEVDLNRLGAEGWHVIGVVRCSEYSMTRIVLEREESPSKGAYR